MEPCTIRCQGCRVKLNIVPDQQVGTPSAAQHGALAPSVRQSVFQGTGGSRVDGSFVLLSNAARRNQAGLHVVPRTASYVCPVLHALTFLLKSSRCSLSCKPQLNLLFQVNSCGCPVLCRPQRALKASSAMLSGTAFLLQLGPVCCSTVQQLPCALQAPVEP